MATSLFAPISAASSGDNIIAAGMAGRKIRLLTYLLSSTGDNTVTFKDGSVSVGLSGQMQVIKGTPLSMNEGPLIPGGQCSLMETSPSNPLVINLASSVPLGGHCTYVYEKM